MPIFLFIIFDSIFSDRYLGALYGMAVAFLSLLLIDNLIDSPKLEAATKAKPSLLRRLLYRLGFYVRGWVDCPSHGWTFDPLRHGYHGPFYYHSCQAKDCDYAVEFL